ncbi:MAG: UPF0280 family protein [Roseovarius sp.]|nr:UPF0280 family protein [Roseovarius sp.]
MSAPQAALLKDGARLHLQHGPIDLIIGADAACASDRVVAFDAARTRFETVLTELTSELPLLRTCITKATSAPAGVIARRMYDAVRAHMSRSFVTPMAAVAGAVADEVLHSMTQAAPLTRAYVNNGGDIALHLSEGQQFTAAIAGLTGAALGQVRIPAAAGICGIATSGQGGRSLSLGIADSVTILGASAASADAAATLIANAVDLPHHPNVQRLPANHLHPDSDLGDRAIVTHVGSLSQDEIALALDRGLSMAYAMKEENHIHGAYLHLRGNNRLVGRIPMQSPKTDQEVAYG